MSLGFLCFPHFRREHSCRIAVGNRNAQPSESCSSGNAMKISGSQAKCLRRTKIIKILLQHHVVFVYFFFRLKYLPLYGPLWQFGQPLPAKAVFLLIDIKSRQRWSKQILNLNYKLHGTFYQFYTDEKLTIPSVKGYLLYPFIAPKINIV